MNNIIIENIKLSMEKEKDKLFKELIIKYLVKQISESN